MIVRSLRRAVVVLLAVAAVAGPLVGAPGPARAAERDGGSPLPGAGGAAETAERPRIGLVLAGGGARGGAHVGVLQVLDDLRVPVDVVAGTSMGAIVGGLFALGRSPDDLERAIERIDWVDVFDDAPDRTALSFRRKQDDLNFLTSLRLGFRDGSFFIPAGFIEGQKLSRWLRRLALVDGEAANFQDLRIPFRAVATDIETGAEVRLGTGDLATAMRASMSIPGVFTPVDLGGRRLVDGLLANNVPVDAARELGVDVFIVVDISTPLRELDELDSAFAISEQSLDVVTARKRREQIENLRDGIDIVIRPDLGDITVASFTQLEEAIEIGRRSAERRSGALEALSLPEDEYAAWRERVGRSESPAPVVREIELDNGSGLADAAILRKLRVEPGEPLDLDRLFEDLAAIYGTDAMEFVDFDLTRIPDEQGGGSRLHIRTEERLRGRHYLRFGLNLDTDFGNDAVYNVAVNHVAYPLDEWGREWRTLLQLGSTIRVNTEVYQPLGASERFYLLPRIDFERSPISRFVDERRVARYDVQTLIPGLLVGANFDRYARLQAGLGWVEGESELDIGDPAQFPDDFFSGGVAQFELDIDTLDNTSFPNRGILASATLDLFREDLGWSDDFERLTIQANVFETFGRNTIGLGVEYGTTFGSASRVQTLFDLGGFLRLSSRQQGERVGRHFGIARLVGYRRIVSPVLLSWEFPVYVGASLEVGDAWEDRSQIEDELLWAGSLFLGAETPLGPLYVAYGGGEGGTHQGYLFLGRRF